VKQLSYCTSFRTNHHKVIKSENSPFFLAHPVHISLSDRLLSIQLTQTAQLCFNGLFPNEPESASSLRLLQNECPTNGVNAPNKYLLTIHYTYAQNHRIAPQCTVTRIHAKIFTYLQRKDFTDACSGDVTTECRNSTTASSSKLCKICSHRNGDKTYKKIEMQKQETELLETDRLSLA